MRAARKANDWVAPLAAGLLLGFCVASTRPADASAPALAGLSDPPLTTDVALADDLAGNNRLVQTTDPAPFQYTTSSTYDAVSNRLTQIDRRGHTTAFAYDGLNRVIRTTAPAPFGYTRPSATTGWATRRRRPTGGGR